MRLNFLSFKLLASTFCAAGLLTFSATAQAPNDVRIAVVIGNSAYAGSMALANPSNDAKDMAAILRNMGFGVIEVLDGNRAQMMEAIERANKQLQGKQGVGMLFYAGHGLQLDWHNFMVPVDAKLNSSKDVPVQTVDIEIVMKSFQQAGNRMNIVVLDACRDDPFANGKTSSGKGLAPLDAPIGTFLAYATAPGNVAQDGTGKNGLYTGFLLQEIQKPTARIEDVFKRVRFAVRKASNGAQIPWEATSLEDDFIFNSGIKKAVPLTEVASNKQFDIEKADWGKIKASKNADDFYAYLQKYPNGLITEQATFALGQLASTKVIAQADKNGIPQDAREKRFRIGDEYVIAIQDGYSGAEITRNTLRVESIKNGLVNIKGTLGDEVRTEDGATAKTVNTNNSNEFDPPTPYQPGDEFQVGKKWISKTMQIDSSQYRKLSRTDEGKVVAIEDINVPAGKFKTYKVVINSTREDGFRIKNTFWYEPGWGIPIVRLREVYQQGGGYSIYEKHVLISRKRGVG